MFSLIKNIMNIKVYDFLILGCPGSIFRPNGWPASRCNMRTSCVIVKHKRHIHRSRRRSGERNALHHQRASREFHNRWWKNRILQLHHPKTWWLLRRRIANMGLDALLIKSQPSIFHSDSQDSHRSGSICPKSRRPQIRRQPIQAPPQ